MFGDGAYGEASYGGPSDDSVSPFQDRSPQLEISITAQGAGSGIEPSVGQADFGFFASGAGAFRLTRVKVIQTVPRSGRGSTRLSHTGQN